MGHLKYAPHRERWNIENCADWKARASSPLKTERHACRLQKGRAGANALSGKLFHDKTNIAEFGQKECAIFPTEEKGGQNRLLKYRSLNSTGCT
ncbi:hypothetical protein HED49_10615 [Ochrobactrum daejeonense]|nr:hypothetical protein [Brucella daejeonensis]